MPKRPDFDKVWELFVSLIRSKRCVTAPEILKELKHPDYIDSCEIYKRIRPVEHLISFRKKRDQEFHDVLGQLHFKFPQLCKSRSRRARPADPYVIATAKRCGFVVVSEETLARRPSRKIPHACVALGVRCLTVGEVLAAERTLLDM
jgi:hypothetical protein